MAGLTKDAELHQMKESEKELLGLHAKPLSELEEVTVDKIDKDDNREYVREVLATPLRSKKTWATDIHNMDGSQNALCSVTKAWHTHKTVHYMNPFICDSRIGKTNGRWSKSDQWLLGKGLLTGEVHEGAFWDDENIVLIWTPKTNWMVHLKFEHFIIY